MPVGVQRCLNVLVTEPIANLQGASTHVNQMGGVAVPGIMYADFVQPGQLDAALQFMFKSISYKGKACPNLPCHSCC